jgi:organic hydroperoxide reductase OsmC/OhrA
MLWTVGRSGDGRVVSSDNVLAPKLTIPREMGGTGDVGTNPEQLAAAGYPSGGDLPGQQKSQP